MRAMGEGRRRGLHRPVPSGVGVVMEELYARIEALERRLERAEAALRDKEAWGPRLPSVRPFSGRRRWGLWWVWGLLVGPVGGLAGSCSGALRL